MHRTALIAILLFTLSSCASATPIRAQPEIVSVYNSPAASPWLTDLYVCANELSIVLNVTPGSPDIFIRVDEPETLASPAYQIDEEEILIVTHRESPLQNLTPEEAQALFAGSGDPSLQVWTYAPEEDLQVAFDRLVMRGQRVTSFARLATSPQQMSDALNADVNAVGILPRHWKMGTVRDVYSAGTVPVLAVTKSEPTGAARRLIACLQK